MDRPVIGMTLMIDGQLVAEVERGLREPLERGGALVLMLPRATPAQNASALLDLLDGVLVTGGHDVDPSLYGAERHPLTLTVPPAEDAFEIALVREALDRGVPVFGLCRGIQVLAVADGGTLTQDVETLHPGALPHSQKWKPLALEPDGAHWHDVEVKPGSDAERWFADGPRRVNSFHHQAVAQPGRRLAATAHATDGVIEAIERVDGRGYAIGTQWHDEMMWALDARFLGPFDDFLAAAHAHAAAPFAVAAD